VHICFVCTGNICRSPMAGLIFTEHLRRADLDGHVRVSSAGTGPWHAGEPMDRRARNVLAAHGYPTEHIATQLTGDHLAADLLVALDHDHLRGLRRLVADRERIRLLRSFDPDATDLAVADPYYGTSADFAEVLAAVEGAVPGLLAWIRDRMDD
jgi:low molecular weight protein-tyrosine phosphatase